MAFFGLIPAAGAGARMGETRVGETLPKQYLKLAGRPMLEHAARALLAAVEIETVFVVLTPGDPHFRNIDWGRDADRIAPLYCGGVTRRDSVLNGLVAASSLLQASDWVLVHDAARPCLGLAELSRLIALGSEDSVGGLLAVPVADTLKRADEAGRAAATEPRDGLWQAQTPQMFRHGVLLNALSESGQVTDEAAAVEHMGLKPLLVEGARDNLKVTYPADIALAEYLLKGRP
jgi:2-C-methyl-D-erythritol 4-phosphate cytidylyltransferase